MLCIRSNYYFSSKTNPYVRNDQRACILVADAALKIHPMYFACHRPFAVAGTESLLTAGGAPLLPPSSEIRFG